MAVRRREYKKQGKQIWSYDFFHKGNRYREAGFPSKKEAEIAEAKVKRDVFSGKINTTSKSLSYVASEFLKHRKQRRAWNTYWREEKKLQRFILKYFADCQLSDLNVRSINDFMQLRLQEGKQPRTINLDLTLLSSLFKYAIANGYAKENPVRSIEYLKVPQKEHRIPTDEEFERFVIAARQTRFASQLVAYIKLSAFTGIRPNEALHLQWERDIDFERNQITVRPQEGSPVKDGKYRAIEIHPELREELLAWRSEWDRKFNGSRPHDWVFFHPRFPDRRSKGFRKGFMTAAQKAEIPFRMTPYTLRHFFISKAVMSGCDYLAIRTWSGHSSIKMIENVYGHLDQSFRRSEMAKLQISSRNKNKKA